MNTAVDDPFEPDPSSLDPWAMLGLPGAVSAAAFLSSSKATQYRLIVEILAERQTTSLTGVGHDELQTIVRERLPTDSSSELIDALNLDDRLAQLVSWGTCEAWQEPANTEADFLRNRSRYQLTEAGAELHRVAQRLEIELGAGSTAALMAPASVAERLAEVMAALSNRDMEKASSALAQVQTTVENMAAAAATWQSKLAAALGGNPDESKLTRLLETILAYVDAWGSGVDAYSLSITEHLPDLAATTDDTWRALALARLQAGAPDHAIDAAVTELKTVGPTLERWFQGEGAQARLLRRQIRDAVAPVLRAHRTLLAVGGTISRRSELIKLATAIDASPDDEAAWQLWCSATGLFTAKHLRQATPEIARPHLTSVWDAPPAPVSQRLRQQGHRSLSGRASRLPDNSSAIAAARRQAAADRLDLATAEQSLRARSGTALSSWQALGSTEAALFLDLISAAREHKDSDGTMTAVSPDGRWRVVLRPAYPPAIAVVRTPAGCIVLDDHVAEFLS